MIIIMYIYHALIKYYKKNDFFFFLNALTAVSSLSELNNINALTAVFHHSVS